jgi:hypothetical protein
LLIFSILLLNDFVAVRATPRDLLLHEIPTNLFSMILTILNIKTFDSKKMYYLKSFSLLIPVFLLIYFNSKQSLNYIFSPFKGTLNEESFFHNTYAGPRTPYQQIVNTFYGSELYSKKRTEDKLFSRYFKQHINAVKHSLDLNAKPNLRYIGPFAEGRQVSLFNDFKNFKLLNLPNSYKEPIVYDFLSDLTSQNRVSFKLHPRPDIQTALYSANLEHWKSFRQKDCLFEEAPDVVLKSDIQTRTIKGFYIYGSRCEISVAKLDLQNLSFLVLDAHNLSILSKHRKPAKGTIPTEW